MDRHIAAIAGATFAGIAAVFILPPLWLGPMSVAAAVCAFAFAIVVRLGTATKPPENPVAGILLSALNLPEEPLAKVKPGWALTSFLALTAFLASVAVMVMVRANF